MIVAPDSTVRQMEPARRLAAGFWTGPGVFDARGKSLHLHTPQDPFIPRSTSSVTEPPLRAPDPGEPVNGRLDSSCGAPFRGALQSGQVLVDLTSDCVRGFDCPIDEAIPAASDISASEEYRRRRIL